MALEFSQQPIIHLLLVPCKLSEYSKELYHFHANKLLYIVLNNKTALESNNFLLTYLGLIYRN